MIYSFQLKKALCTEEFVIVSLLHKVLASNFYSAVKSPKRNRQRSFTLQLSYKIKY